VKVTPEQIKAARQLLGWSCVKLALNSPVGLTTIHKIESKRGPRNDRAILGLQATLEAAGVIFVEEKGFGAGVRLRKPRGEPGAVSAIERAFQLARSGSIGNVAELKLAMYREGYDWVEIEVPEIRRQLRYLIRTARGAVEPEPK
jgi:hypothetical protein